MLADFPLPDHVQQLDNFLREAKLINPDGTEKTPKKRKPKSPLKAESTPSKKPKKTPVKSQATPKKKKKGKK
jgi:hypothetical protein